MTVTVLVYYDWMAVSQTTMRENDKKPDDA